MVVVGVVVMSSSSSSGSTVVVVVVVRRRLRWRPGLRGASVGRGAVALRGGTVATDVPPALSANTSATSDTTSSRVTSGANRHIVPGNKWLHFNYKRRYFMFYN